MKKDILHKEVDQVAIVIAPRPEDAEHNDLWDTFLVNLYAEPIHSVLISSRGYGEVNGEKMTTTTLRHFFETIESGEMASIEPIQPSLFQLNNEFWVSFVLKDHMYDRKYVFVQDSIHESKLTHIPFANREGVMIR